MSKLVHLHDVFRAPRVAVSRCDQPHQRRRRPLRKVPIAASDLTEVLDRKWRQIDRRAFVLVLPQWWNPESRGACTDDSCHPTDVSEGVCQNLERLCGIRLKVVDEHKASACVARLSGCCNGGTCAPLANGLIQPRRDYVAYVDLHDPPLKSLCVQMHTRRLPDPGGPAKQKHHGANPGRSVLEPRADTFPRFHVAKQQRRRCSCLRLWLFRLWLFRLWRSHESMHRGHQRCRWRTRLRTTEPFRWMLCVLVGRFVGLALRRGFFDAFSRAPLPLFHSQRTVVELWQLLPAHRAANAGFP